MRRLSRGLIVAALTLVACDNATYAPGFSEDAFRKVQLGMSLAEVKALLGEPLESQESTPGEVWRYGEIAGPAQGPRTWVFQLAGNPVVVFGEDQLVQKSYEAPGVNPGLSMEEVHHLLGEPSARHVLKNALVLHYSSPGDSGRSEIRIIGIGRDNRVSQIDSYSFDE
jgi:hypothetical protein